MISAFRTPNINPLVQVIDRERIVGLCMVEKLAFYMLSCYKY